MEFHKETSSTPVAVAAKSVAMYEYAKKAAQSNASVLIEGETGTGKEVLANYIHQNSSRAQYPFISVNCAALPENMIEAILFGHEKGAFTGAICHHVGKFEQADRGTLLLDEISEIPYALQAKLLRVLQEKKVERIGGNKEIGVDVRIIAATNADLITEVKEGKFRKDLYYRINVIKFQCIALRDRKEDIIPLAKYFIKIHAANNQKSCPELSTCAKDKFINYPWPGNVRELENVIQRIIVMNECDVISEENIKFDEMNINLPIPILEKNEAIAIIDMLKETSGCRITAARNLKISPRTLRYKISKLKEIGMEVPTRGVI